MRMKKAASIFKILFFVSLGLRAGFYVCMALAFLTVIIVPLSLVFILAGWLLLILSFIGIWNFLPLWIVFHNVSKALLKKESAKHSPKTGKKPVKVESKKKIKNKSSNTEAKKVEKTAKQRAEEAQTNQTVEADEISNTQESDTSAEAMSDTDEDLLENSEVTDTQEADASAEVMSGTDEDNQELEPSPSLGDSTHICLDSFTVFEEEIHYNKEKHESIFARSEGFVGSAPRNFIDNNMPVCPYCQTNEPVWHFMEIRLMEWRGTIVLNRCSKCNGIITVSLPDIRTFNFFNPADKVIASNLLAKKTAGKEAKVPYLTFEDVGNSGIDPSIVGKEIRLQDMQAVSRR